MKELQILMPRGKNNGTKEYALSSSPPLSNSSSCCMCKIVPNLVYYAHFPFLCCFTLEFCSYDAPLASFHLILDFGLEYLNLNEPNGSFGLVLTFWLLSLKRPQHP